MATYRKFRPIGCLEVLEPRRLLAGDAMVSVRDGNLVIQGDFLDNQIAITAGPTVGGYQVSGLNGTNVHFESEPPGEAVRVTGVRGNVNVDLGDGNDKFMLAGANVRGSVSVRGGNGDDQVLVGSMAPASGNVPASDEADESSLSIRGGLEIDTGSGNDHVRVDSISLRGPLEVRTGDGMDEVGLGPLTTSESAPSEVVDRSGSGSTGGRRVSGTSGNPPSTPGQDSSVPSLQLRSIRVDLGSGNDMLAMNSVHARTHVSVIAGDGDDTIDARHSNVLGMVVNGGEGIDDVAIDSLDAAFLSISTGAGSDHVKAVDSVFTAVHVSLGEGDDELITGGVAAQLAILLGDEGKDSVLELRENDFDLDFSDGFELPAFVDRLPGDWPFGGEHSSGARRSAGKS
jgi:hypothetical protein